MPEPGPKLAIVDWGIGGLGIYRLIRSQLGDMPVLYFSDTGVTPYGRMSREQLVDRLSKVFSFLEQQGVSHVVVGCNAASTVLPLMKIDKLRVAGVIEGAIAMIAKLSPPKLALIGGRRTVLSGVYRRGFAERGINLTQRIAQPLSALIEAGDTSSPELREECRKILGPIRDSSHLLLACTHYPAITSVIRDYVSRSTVMIDPANELIRTIRRWRLKQPTGGQLASDRFITSGNSAKMKVAAFNAFGVKIRKIERAVF